MDRRSSSGTHVQGDFVARVESSHGVRLDGGSTGGIVEAFGTDTSISLTVRAKGVGILTLGQSTAVTAVVGSTVTIGTSTSPVLIEGSSVTIGVSTSPVRILASSVYLNSTQLRLGSTASSVVIGNSTTFLSGIELVRIQFTPPALAANACEDVAAGSSHAAFSTSASYLFTPFSGQFSTKYTVPFVYCDTATELRIRMSNNAASTIGTGESTQSANILIFKHA